MCVTPSKASVSKSKRSVREPQQRCSWMTRITITISIKARTFDITDFSFVIFFSHHQPFFHFLTRIANHKKCTHKRRRRSRVAKTARSSWMRVRKRLRPRQELQICIRGDVSVMCLTKSTHALYYKRDGEKKVQRWKQLEMTIRVNVQ